jgi:4-fold beta-flower domain-containing protein
MTPIFDQDCDLVGWFDGEHVFDLDLEWVAFYRNGHLFSSSALSWLGPFHNGSLLDPEWKASCLARGDLLQARSDPLHPSVHSSLCGLFVRSAP